MIFLGGIGAITIFSALIDILFVRVFPFCCCVSIFATFLLWVILLAYSSAKYKENQETPECAKWYMFFCLPILHIAFVAVGLIGVGMLVGLFR